MKKQDNPKNESELVDVIGFDDELVRIMDGEFSKNFHSDESDPDYAPSFGYYDVPVEKLKPYFERLRHVNIEIRRSKDGLPLTLADL